MDTDSLRQRFDSLELLILRLWENTGAIMSDIDTLNSKIDDLGSALNDSRDQTDKLLAGMGELRAELAAAAATGTPPDLTASIAKLDALAAGVRAETSKETAAMIVPAVPPSTPPVSVTPPTPVEPTPTAPTTPADVATAATADAAAIPVGIVPATDAQKAQASPSIDSGATVLQSTTDTNPFAAVATTVPGGDGNV